MKNQGILWIHTFSVELLWVGFSISAFVFQSAPLFWINKLLSMQKMCFYNWKKKMFTRDQRGWGNDIHVSSFIKDIKLLLGLLKTLRKGKRLLWNAIKRSKCDIKPAEKSNPLHSSRKLEKEEYVSLWKEKCKKAHLYLYQQMKKRLSAVCAQK